MSWKCVPCLKFKGVTNITFLGEEDDVFGYSAVHVKSKMLVFGFRGTRNLKNWINNLKIAKPNAPFPNAPENAKIHYGFLSDYEKVKDQFLEIFKKYVSNYPEFQVKIIGHSLGGALALLASVDLATQNILVFKFQINDSLYIKPSYLQSECQEWVIKIGQNG